VSERAPASHVTRQGPLGPLGGFLERFRRSGGVPAAVGGDAASELAEVFAALDRLETEADELRSGTRSAVERRGRELDRDAQRIVADARAGAEAKWNEVMTAELQAVDAEAAGILARGELDAARIAERGQERLPAFVAGVLDRVLEAGG